MNNKLNDLYFELGFSKGIVNSSPHKETREFHLNLIKQIEKDIEIIEKNEQNKTENVQFNHISV